MPTTRSRRVDPLIELDNSGRVRVVRLRGLNGADIARAAFADTGRTADDESPRSDEHDLVLDDGIAPKVDLANQSATLDLLNLCPESLPAVSANAVPSVSSTPVASTDGFTGARRARKNARRRAQHGNRLDDMTETVTAPSDAIASVLDIRTYPDRLEAKPYGHMSQSYEETRDFIVLDCPPDKITNIVLEDGSIIASVSQVYLKSETDRNDLRDATDDFVHACKSDPTAGNPRGVHENFSDGVHAQHSRQPLFARSQSAFASAWSKLHARPTVQRIGRMASNHAARTWPALARRSFKGRAFPVWHGGPVEERTIRDPAWVSPNGHFQQVCVNGGLSSAGIARLCLRTDTCAHAADAEGAADEEPCGCTADERGEQVLCRKHRDSKNFGPCVVMSEAGGYEDPRRELFALALYDLHLILRLHPYSFVAYPVRQLAIRPRAHSAQSGLLTHGNMHLPLREAHLAAATIDDADERRRTIREAEVEVERVLSRGWRRSWVYFTQGMWQRWAEATALGTRAWDALAVIEDAARKHAEFWGAQ